MESTLEVLGGNQVRSGKWKTQKKLIFTDEVIHAASPQLSTLFGFFKENGCKVQEFVEMLGSTLEVTVIRCYRNKTEVK